MAYLLLHGELPTAASSTTWRHEITYHTYIHENVRKRFLEGFHYDAHPMGMLVSAVAALSTFYLDAKDIFDPESRHRQVIRLIAKMPTLAAAAHRFSVGMPFVYPDNSLDFCANFLSMMWKVAEPRFDANPTLARALDILFILHADHEQNCSTTAMRVVGSSHADPYSCCAAACAALYGPRHGGANEAVIRMLTEIGSIDNVPSSSSPSSRAMDGSRASATASYKSYDPRAKIIKRTADEVFAITGKNPLLDIALKLEEIALNDEYFTSRRLYPTSTSTRASSTRRWGSRSRCSPCSSPSPAPPGGSRTGRSCSTRTRRSPGPASSTSAPSRVPTCRSTSAEPTPARPRDGLRSGRRSWARGASGPPGPSTPPRCRRG